MLILTTLSVVTALASAADYSAIDPLPPTYVSEKPQIAPISGPLLAVIAKILDAIQGYDYDLPEPVLVGDGLPAEQSYPDGELLKLLNLLLQNKPKKYSPKTTVKILDRLPGLYGAIPPYALHPSLLSAPYKRPSLGLLHPYPQPPLNLVYPPGLPAYHLPLHPAPKLRFNPAGVYGYPGYAPSALGLPQLPLIILTKSLLDSLKADNYDADPAVEAPADPVYASVPSKPVVKVVAAAKKNPNYAKAKVLPKAYAVKVKPLTKVVKAKSHYKTATVVAPVVEVSAPAYAAAVTEAPVDLYPVVEARAAGGEETQSSSGSVAAAVKASGKQVGSTAHSTPEGGESARASLTDHSISSQKTISRIS